ncbi:saccharopine dehydrogenase family protein [Streptomyces sp. NPDC091377]|uniref:saccharopine dehydrogenase family protein n=1 Tax=Streptomyces sp. NPDC091377 TaxID=3365995 RepID=UPI0038073814
MTRLDTTDRAYDVVLFGATGFVGTLTAEHLAARAPKGLRWAVAGRSEQRLRALCDRLPGGDAIGVLPADAHDPDAMRALAGQARVVATATGPYQVHGERLVAACADLGTDYVDLCGEPEFVDLMYVRHEARARETGARLVHAAGFESVPYDLGTSFTVRHLPEGVPLTVDVFVSAGGMFSGGTFASALGQFARVRHLVAAARDRRRYEPRLVGRRVAAPASAPRFVGEVGAWAVPLPTVDPWIVCRSARALERYGPDFRYRQYAAVRRLPIAVGGVVAVGALAAAAQVPAVRRRLSDRYPPGEGPSAEKRERSWFSLRFVGEGAGRRVFTEVTGGDPGYGATAAMFGEAALALALDDLPDTAGQVTTAVAMGDALTERLRHAGLRFRVAATR